MNIFKAILRSLKKSMVLKKAIKMEKSSVDENTLYKERKKAYGFLCSDEILSDIITDFSFEQFSHAIERMKELGIKYSSTGDYVPIASFFFLPSLSVVHRHFIKNELDLRDMHHELSDYFGEIIKPDYANAYKSYYYKFIEFPIVNKCENYKPLTAALLFLIFDLTLTQTKKDVRLNGAQSVFNFLQYWNLSNAELNIFDNTVDLMGQIVRGVVSPRGMWCYYNSGDNFITKLFICYGDLLCFPEYLNNYAEAPIILKAANTSLDFMTEFNKIQDEIIEFAQTIIDMINIFE